MRLPNKKSKSLTRRELRTIERELGVFLDAPSNPTRCTHQQFSVYDENEKSAGDVFATDTYFTELELCDAIRDLFGANAKNKTRF